jgi:hypothetical protein
MQPSIPKLFEEYKDLATKVAQYKVDIALGQSELSKAELRMKQIERQLKSSSKEKSQDDNSPDGFGGTNLSKAIYILTLQNKFMTVRQIAEAINQIEPVDDLRKYQGTLSSTLSTNAKDGKKIVRYKDQDDQDWIYGLIQWSKEHKIEQDEH